MKLAARAIYAALARCIEPGIALRIALCIVFAAVWSLPAHSQDESINQRLLNAARSNDEPAVEAALNDGAAIDSRNRIGDTPLITACKKGSTAMARMLVEHGANVRQADVAGITPLMAAAYGGDADMVGLLLAHGADTGAEDRVGKTAMEYAAGQGST